MATSKNPNCCSSCGSQCDITKNWQMTLTDCNNYPYYSLILIKPTAEFDEALNWFDDNIIFDSPDEPGFHHGCKDLALDVIYFDPIFVAYFEDGYIESSSCPDPGTSEYSVAYRISSTPYSLIHMDRLYDHDYLCGRPISWDEFSLSIDFNNEYPPMCGPLTYPTPVFLCDWREVYCE